MTHLDDCDNLAIRPAAGRRRAAGARAAPGPSRATRATSQSTLREVLALTARPGVLSLALGMPAEELFPAAELAAAGARALAPGGAALQYGMPLRALRCQVVELMALRGVACREEQVFLTSGAQQGMHLAAQLLLDPGAKVAVERTVYDGVLQVLKSHMPQIVAVPAGPERGIDLAALEALLAGGARPALLYVIPDGHNPLGVSLDTAGRRRLVELARAFRVPILEDDAYGLLAYDGPAPPPLRALDDRWVLYLGSFSKILAPALRVGWLVVPKDLVPALSALKHAADLDVATLGQHTVSHFLAAGALPAHLETLRAGYARRRDLLLRALAERFPPGACWHRPVAGMFVWVELPPPLDTAALLQRAVEDERVAFAPGRAFAATGGPESDHCLRLCFAAASPEAIEDGVARIGRVLERALDRLPAAAAGR